MIKIRYALIRDTDISNGEGIRVSLFVQGCPFHCKGCFNEDTWDFNGGKEWSKDIENTFINLGKPSYIKGYSILGGEPLAQDKPLLDLVKQIKKSNNKTIWMWTGFTYENLNEFQKEIVSYIDVLVDGQFVEEQRDLSLRFKGSKNQRLIDVQKSLKEGKIILWN